MYLKELTIQNYKCFEHFTIPFDEKLTVLVGNNGSGKTTVLDAAQVALGTMLRSFETAKSIGILKDDVRREVYTIGESEDVKPIYPAIITAVANIAENTVEWTRSLNSPKGNTTIIGAGEMIEVSDRFNERLQAGDQCLILPAIMYYGTGRLFDYHREKKQEVFKTDNRLNGYIDCLDSTANIKLMANWFKKKTVEKYQRIERGSAPDPALEIVTKAMEEIYRKASGYTDINIQYSLSREEPDIWYTDCNGKRMCLPLSQLSAGFRTVISLVADISYRMATLNPNLSDAVLKETPGIIMIDEIDQHLHPLWQKRIIRDLRDLFPAVQFIITTHAPSIINTVKSEHIRILSDLKLDEIVTETYGKDNNGIVKSVMKASERPDDVTELFDRFYRLLNENGFSEAENVLNNLESIIDENDPELVACRVKLDLNQM